MFFQIFSGTIDKMFGRKSKGLSEESTITPEKLIFIIPKYCSSKTWGKLFKQGLFYSYRCNKVFHCLWIRLNKYIYNFSVDYNTADVRDIVDIHKSQYLMKVHNITIHLINKLLLRY